MANFILANGYKNAKFNALQNFLLYSMFIYYYSLTGVVSMIKRRCSDDKVAVRKAAVQTITNLAKLRESGIQEQVQCT